MKKLWLAVLVLLLTAVPVFAEPLTIAVEEKAVVKGPVITLGEIAELSGSDMERINRLSALKLGSAPAPGTSLTLTQELIGMRLAATGADFSGVTWHTPSAVIVTTSSQAVSGTTLADIARQSLAAKLAGNDGEITVTVLTVPADLLAPLGNIRYTVDIPGGIRFTAPTTAYVLVAVDGRRYSSIPVRLEAKLYRQVIVAARPIRAQEAIATDNIRFERMDAGRLTGYITDANQILGLTSRRLIAAGTPITGAVLEKPILVKRGSLVNIVARAGSAEITAAGLAMQDGAQDQLIRVQNVNSKRILSARVENSSTVLVGTYTGK